MVSNMVVSKVRMAFCNVYAGAVICIIIVLAAERTVRDHCVEVHACVPERKMDRGMVSGMHTTICGCLCGKCGKCGPNIDSY